MVVFNCKCGPDGDAFLYETTTDTPNDGLIAALVSLHNGRILARVVVDAVRGLAAAGPMVEPSAAEAAGRKEEQQQSVPRCGNAPDPDHVEALNDAAAELGQYVDKAQAKKRVVVSEAGIAELVGKVREAIRFAYPDGLPEWDVLSKLSSTEVQEDEAAAVEEEGSNGICPWSLQDLLPADAVAGAPLLQPKATSVWVAGKEFERGKLISDRFGSNEKTRVVAKLSRDGDGPPPREPIVRDDERNAMLEHYHKRNEELKRLADNEEDEYMNSAWADPQNMARDLQGLGSVRAPGLHRFG